MCRPRLCWLKHALRSRANHDHRLDTLPASRVHPELSSIVDQMGLRMRILVERHAENPRICVAFKSRNRHLLALHARHEGCYIQYLGLVRMCTYRATRCADAEPAHMNRGNSQNDSITFCREGACHGQETLIDGRRQELLALLDATHRTERVASIGSRRRTNRYVLAVLPENRRSVNGCRVRTACRVIGARTRPELGCRCTLTVVETDFDEMP